MTPAVDTGTTPLEALISLRDKRALVTGAASGIGLASCRRLAEAGAALLLVDRDAQGLETAAKELHAAGREVALHPLNLADREAIRGFWESLAEPPDILVNNAGIFPARAFDEVDAAFYEQVRAVNLDAVLWMCQHMIKRRGRRGGVIVNLASIEAVLPFKDDLVVYSVSKAGVIALSRALAREYAGRGVRVNVVLPGGIITPGTGRVARDILRGQLGLLKTGYDFQQRLPAGRPGTPDEVARVVLFLASDLAAYLHGAVIPVDGGFLSA